MTPDAGSSHTGAYRLLLDVPSESPALGFKKTAQALAEIIADSEPRFAISIFGGWGSGKTTLMHEIARCLDSDSTVTTEFTAWRYEREEHLIIPLLDTVREAVLDWGEDERHRAQRNRARETATTVGRAMTSILAGVSMKVGVPGAVELSFDANKALDSQRRARGDNAAARVSRSFYHASFSALRKTFKDFVGETQVQRIVVFVDDLDRCLPDSALQVLESMKLFFDLPGFVFVVGLDNEIVQGAIDSKYRSSEADPGARTEGAGSRVSGTDYVKKIFQLPYRVTPVSVGQLPDFLATAYDEASLEAAQREDLETTAIKHLKFLVGDAAVNPREIKRYINAYTIVRKIEPTLEPDAVLAWQTITFREEWDLVRIAFLSYGVRFAEAVGERVNLSSATALSNIDPALDSIPDDFLDYVAVGGPGHALLTVGNLDRYIASGETVGSTLNPLMLDALRATGEVLLTLAEMRRRRQGASPEQSKELRNKISTVLRSSSSTPGVTVIRIGEDVAKFETGLDELNQAESASWDELAPMIENLEQLAQAIRDRLQRLYRTGDVGGSSPSSSEAPDGGGPESASSAA